MNPLFYNRANLFSRLDNKNDCRYNLCKDLHQNELPSIIRSTDWFIFLVTPLGMDIMQIANCAAGISFATDEQDSDMG